MQIFQTRIKTTTTGVLMAKSMTRENNRKCYVSDIFLFEFDKQSLRGGQPTQIIIDKNISLTCLYAFHVYCCLVGRDFYFRTVKMNLISILPSA